MGAPAVCPPIAGVEAIVIIIHLLPLELSPFFVVMENACARAPANYPYL
jgi:hypothetical protein